MSKRRSSGSGRGQSSLGYLFGTTSKDEVDDLQDHSKMIISPAPISNSGGGQSSLGYLFGSNDALLLSQDISNHNINDELIKVVSSSPTLLPPYGTHDDVMEEKTTPSPLIKKYDNCHNGHPSSKSNTNCVVVYHKVDGKSSSSSGDFLITGRPSTRVRSAPGGNSSIGYLFGDK